MEKENFKQLIEVLKANKIDYNRDFDYILSNDSPTKECEKLKNEIIDKIQSLTVAGVSLGFKQVELAIIDLTYCATDMVEPEKKAKKRIKKCENTLKKVNEMKINNKKTIDLTEPVIEYVNLAIDAVNSNLTIENDQLQQEYLQEAKIKLEVLKMSMTKIYDKTSKSAADLESKFVENFYQWNKPFTQGNMNKSNLIFLDKAQREVDNWVGLREQSKAAKDSDYAILPESSVLGLKKMAKVALVMSRHDNFKAAMDHQLKDKEYTQNPEVEKLVDAQEQLINQKRDIAIAIKNGSVPQSMISAKLNEVKTIDMKLDLVNTKLKVFNKGNGVTQFEIAKQKNVLQIYKFIIELDELKGSRMLYSSLLDSLPYDDMNRFIYGDISAQEANELFGKIQIAMMTIKKQKEEMLAIYKNMETMQQEYNTEINMEEFQEKETVSQEDALASLFAEFGLDTDEQQVETNDEAKVVQKDKLDIFNDN